ncbi:hypothetical protein [Tateyamaria sp.]|uniref:hypothetical protein n=1 Tax=Tateyamaria sp. TaxID=1929288 RepID=UPI0039B9B063
MTTGNGDDSVNGGLGVDTMIDFGGNDTFFIDSTAGVISDSGSGIVQVNSTLETTNLASLNSNPLFDAIENILLLEDAGFVGNARAFGDGGVNVLIFLCLALAWRRT